jgi:peptidoglycan/LPS O-acetylase OafA/YrhL
LYGLDTIRFFCALWVVMGHYGAPPLPGFIDKSTAPGLLTIGVYNNLTSGPAAVIVFFVISGLCIHHPNAQGLRIPNLSAYLTRRCLRIFPPMLVATAIGQWVVNVKLALFEQTILWSLLAEIIYYAIYPGLLWLRRCLKGWTPMILVTFAAALLVAATDPSAGDYPSYGRYMNWLLGLPCWLLGCDLAERVGRVPDHEPDQTIWLWRGGILLLATTCSVARFHSPFGYPWTLNFFAIAATAWLFQEAVRFQRIRPLSILERAGTWSYSLYLVHPLAMASYRLLPFDQSRSFMGWCMHMSFILVSSYIFAVLFEFTSHKLARKAAWMISNRNAGSSALAAKV